MKKYYLISEVSELLKISQSLLRYLEKSHPSIKINKIRGRRYYKAEDLEKISKILGLEVNLQERINDEMLEKPKTKTSRKNKENQIVIPDNDKDLDDNLDAVYSHNLSMENEQNIHQLDLFGFSKESKAENIIKEDGQPDFKNSPEFKQKIIELLEFKEILEQRKNKISKLLSAFK